MINPGKGEVAFPVGDKVYQLRLTIETIIKVENFLDIGIVQIADSLTPKKVKAGIVRALLWASMHEMHPEVTIAEAGVIMVQASVTDTVAHLGKLMQAAFPTAEGREGPSPTGDQAGTGNVSL